MNEVYSTLVEQKRAAYGTPAFDLKQQQCSAGIYSEYCKYVERMRVKMRNLPRGSKAWWKLSKELMLQARPCSPIPALLDTGGKWITEASDKANLFAHSFLAKSELPTIITNEFSSIDNESHTS